MSVHKYKPDKKGKCWRFKCSNPDGTIFHSKMFATKKECEEAEMLFKYKKDNPHSKLFGIVANDYFDNLSKTNKASTVYTYQKDYNNHLKDYFGNVPINDINTLLIDKWCLKMEEKHLSINYMNKIYNILSNILNYAMKMYDLKTNYAKVYGRFKSKNDIIVKDKDKIRYITIDEFNKFISVIDDPMYYAIFNFLFYTGVRKGEMIALTWNDIDFVNNIIVIDKTLNEEVKGSPSITSTKNNQNRTIKMSKTLSDIMLNYKHQQMKYTEYNDNWFVFGGDIHLSKTTLDRYKHKYFELSGIHEITIHEFRHSHVSLLVNEYIKSSKEKNMKVDTAKFFLMMSSRMGHTIQVMQDTYLHLFPTIQDEIVDLLDNL